jgi:transposase
MSRCRKRTASHRHSGLGVGEYLRRWGYTPKKPQRHARYQDPEEIREWLEITYPAIEEFAAEEDAEILWCDETGVDSNQHVGIGYALLGEPATIEVSSSPCRMNLISAISNEGEARFMTYAQTMTSALFVTFLTKLIAGASRMLYLIVDRHPTHTAGIVEAWLQNHEQQITMFYLPRRAPELNPVESLNNDMKSGVNATKLPDDVSIHAFVGVGRARLRLVAAAPQSRTNFAVLMR